MSKKTIKQRQIEILKKSVKWWNWYRKITIYEKTDLSKANLSWANLSEANLSKANLSEADLSKANLSEADLDYSCLTFACKTLNAVFDQKHIYQILYHAAKPCFYNPKIVQDEDLHNLLGSELFKKVANKFHRSKECGEL